MLADLLSANAHVRGEAEAAFKLQQQQNPVELCAFLLQTAAGTSQPQQEALVSLALVLLRQTVKLEWASGAKLAVGQSVLDLLFSSSNSNSNNHVNKLMQVLVALPKPLLVENFTPRLVRELEQPTTTAASPVLLALIDGLAEFAYTPELAAAAAPRLAQWLVSSSSSPCQVLLFKASVSLVVSQQEAADSSSKQCLDLMSRLPLAILQFVAAAATAASAATTTTTTDSEDAMQCLGTLVDACPASLDAQLKPICEGLLSLCVTSNSSSKVRALSMTVLASGVAARKANWLCRDSALLTRVVQCVLQMQVESGEDNDALIEDEEENEDDALCLSQSGPRGAALDCIASLALGSTGILADARRLLSTALEQIQPCLAAGASWKHKLAGLSTMGSLGPVLPKQVFRPVLKQVVQGCCALTSNAQEHVKVRYAASAVLQVLVREADQGSGGDEEEGETEDEADDDDAWRSREMRANLHDVILPALASCLLHATAAASTGMLVNIWLLTLCAFYGNSASHDDGEDDEATAFPSQAVAPYLDGLVRMLVKLMMTTTQQEQDQQHHTLCLCMDALASLGSRGKHMGFAAYYSELVPMIKHCLQATKSSQVKKSAMLLIASCAQAVGKDQFAKDGVAILEWFFLQQQQQAAAAQSNSDESNEVEGLFLFCERMVEVLGSEFAPFTPHILPVVARACQADLGLSFQQQSAAASTSASTSSFEADSGQATIAVPVRGVDGGPIEISANVYAFQVRYQALALLERLADANCLPPSQAVVDELLAQCVMPNIANRMCTQSLNVQSSSTAAALFAVSVKSDNALLVQLVTQLVSGLTFDDPGRNLAYAQALESALKSAWDQTKGQCRLPSLLLTNIVPLLMTSFSSSVQRRIGGGGDDEDDDDVDAQEEAELCQCLVDALGFLLKAESTTAAAASSTSSSTMDALYVQHVLPYMNGVVNARDEHVRLHALCCFVDYVEYAATKTTESSSNAYAGAVAVLQHNLKYALVDPKSARLRQIGAYGAGVLALKLPRDGGGATAFCDEYAPLLIRSLRTEKSSSSSSDMDVRDNMVSALAKFSWNQAHARADWQHEFVSQLPLKEDEAEASFCHDLVFSMVLEGAGGSLLAPGLEPSVLRVCAYELSLQNNKKETVAKVIRQMCGGGGGVPRDRVVGWLAGLPPAAQQAVLALAQ